MSTFLIIDALLSANMKILLSLNVPAIHNSSFTINVHLTGRGADVAGVAYTEALAVIHQMNFLGIHAAQLAHIHAVSLWGF